MDVYDDDFGPVPGMERLLLPRAWNQLVRRNPARRERPASAVLARAVPWLHAHRDAPFFAWVHLYDAHGPYHPPDEADFGPPPRVGPALKLPRAWPASDRAITRPGWLAMAYDGEIRAVDTAIGTLLAALGPRLDSTVVAVLSDHGESLGEHDVWFDHGDDLYDPVLRVPWIVRAPGRAMAGLRVGCPVATLDLAPTLLGLTGLADGVARDGLDRTPELGGGTCRPEAVHATTVGARDTDAPPLLHALREDGTKTVLGPDGRVSHYDLRADPFERVDLLATPEVAAAVRARAAAQAERLRGTGAARRAQDAGARAELEALGYVEPPR
jgi:arylsulfatase A-like enzyme